MIEHFFSTPIFYKDLTSLDIISNEVNTEIKTSNIRNAEPVWGDNVDTSFRYWQEGPNDALLKCPTLKNEVDKAVDEFLQGLGILDSYTTDIIDSWINVNHKGQYQHYHWHAINGSDGISGVYYHQSTNDGDDGMLIFKNPSYPNATSNILKSQPSRVFHKPQVGRIILFPSFLEHAVNHNGTDTTRISLSFNYSINFTRSNNV